MASSMSDGSRLSRSTSSIGIFFAYDNEPAADVIIFADRLKQDLEKNGFSVQKVQEVMYYEEDGGIPKIDQSKYEAFLAVTTNKHSCTDSKFCQILHANKIDTNKIYEIFYEKEDGDDSLRCKHDVPMAPEQNQFVFKSSDDHENLLNKLVTTIFKSSGVQECKSDDTCILHQEVTDTKAASKKINFQVIGNKHDIYTWKDYDFSIEVPATAVPQGITVDVPVEVVDFTQDFILPENMYLVSEIYYINVKHEFQDKVTVRMKHRANVDVESFQSNLKMLFAKCSDGPPHVLKQLPLSCDFDENGFASFSIKNFSDFAVASDVFMCKAFYRPRNGGTRWEMVVVMMKNHIDHIGTIVDYYRNIRYSIEDQQIDDVRFDDGCKEITIQVSDAADGWEVRGRSSGVQIKAEQILDFNPSDINYIQPPRCTFDITWKGEDRSPQESPSPRKVSLIGAKDDKYFNLFIPPVPFLPPSYNEAGAIPEDPPPPYDEQQVESSYIS